MAWVNASANIRQEIGVLNCDIDFAYNSINIARARVKEIESYDRGRCDAEAVNCASVIKAGEFSNKDSEGESEEGKIMREEAI
jgi:hypothetical protein